MQVEKVYFLLLQGQRAGSNEDNMSKFMEEKGHSEG